MRCLRRPTFTTTNLVRSSSKLVKFVCECNRCVLCPAGAGRTDVDQRPSDDQRCRQPKNRRRKCACLLMGALIWLVACVHEAFEHTTAARELDVFSTLHVLPMCGMQRAIRLYAVRLDALGARKPVPTSSCSWRRSCRRCALGRRDSQEQGAFGRVDSARIAHLLTLVVVFKRDRL